MTELQKQAITILNNLKSDNKIDNEDYFVLLGFIVNSQTTNIEYVPYYPTITHPYYPTYPEITWKTYC